MTGERRANTSSGQEVRVGRGGSCVSGGYPSYRQGFVANDSYGAQSMGFRVVLYMK